MKKSLNVTWYYTKGDNEYVFCVPYKSSYTDAYDALKEIVNDMQEGEKQALANMKAAEEVQESPSTENAVG